MWGDNEVEMNDISEIVGIISVWLMFCECIMSVLWMVSLNLRSGECKWM